MKLKKLLPLIVLAVASTASAACNSEITKESETEVCSHKKEYQAYIDCIYSHRQKRAACPYQTQNQVPSCAYGGPACPQNCAQCDCNYCASNACYEPCGSCCRPQPVQQQQPQHILENMPECDGYPCCHRYCHSNCPDSSCRKECRRECNDRVQESHNEQTNNNNNNNNNHTLTAKISHNITTIINLHNVINNTNIIDMPVHVNNTNINNITVHAPETQNKVFYAAPSQAIDQRQPENCCRVIGPRQCTPTPTYPYARCFHYRKRQCGSFCKAPIVHAQPHEICDQSESLTPRCTQQVVYIPQPRPKCVYQSAWPYVSCGVQGQQEMSNCVGCYNHYSAATAEPQPPSDGCNGCYDDGFSSGPLYRQGPFYRPGYSHIPSCMQMGTCDFGMRGGVDYNTIPVNFGGLGYAPDSYENSYHIEPIADDDASESNDTQSEIKLKSLTHYESEFVYPPYNPYNNIPLNPYAFNPYSAFGGFGAPIGKPFTPPLEAPSAPNVRIEATVLSPEDQQPNRYARIDIDTSDSNYTNKNLSDDAGSNNKI